VENTKFIYYIITIFYCYYNILLFFYSSIIFFIIFRFISIVRNIIVVYILKGNITLLVCIFFIESIHFSSLIILLSTATYN